MRSWWWAFVLVAMTAAGCLPEIVLSKTDFRPSAPADRPVACLAASATVDPMVGITADLDKGSCWKRVGAVPEGAVYRPVGGVFMVNSANAHEAYLVVEGGAVVGFYLPGESAFAPARGKTVIQLKQKEE